MLYLYLYIHIHSFIYIYIYIYIYIIFYIHMFILIFINIFISTFYSFICIYYSFVYNLPIRFLRFQKTSCGAPQSRQSGFASSMARRLWVGGVLQIILVPFPNLFFIQIILKYTKIFVPYFFPPEGDFDLTAGKGIGGRGWRGH